MEAACEEEREVPPIVLGHSGRPTTTNEGRKLIIGHAAING